MKTITAYIRLTNEEKTILPCLDSIKNIFDSIIILYSNISDNSLSLIDSYILENKISNIKIYRYPHEVLSYGAKEYKTNDYQFENSLACYYKYGLQHIDTDYWMKIDSDQIYFTDKLIISINDILQKNISNYCYDFIGYNTIIMENNIAINKKDPFNGITDHMVIPNNKNIHYIQTDRWELIQLPETFRISHEYAQSPMWFHMRNIYKYVNYQPTNTDRDRFSNENTIKFDNKTLDAYNQYILPLLKKYNSSYQYLKIIK